MAYTKNVELNSTVNKVTKKKKKKKKKNLKNIKQPKLKNLFTNLTMPLFSES